MANRPEPPPDDDHEAWWQEAMAQIRERRAAREGAPPVALTLPEGLSDDYPTPGTGPYTVAQARALLDELKGTS